MKKKKKKKEASSDNDGGSRSAGVQGGEEKKRRKGSFEKDAVSGRGIHLCSVYPYLNQAKKTGKVPLLIKVSHPSAPYSSLPADCET